MSQVVPPLGTSTSSIPKPHFRLRQEENKGCDLSYEIEECVYQNQMLLLRLNLSGKREKRIIS